MAPAHKTEFPSWEGLGVGRFMERGGRRPSRLAILQIAADFVAERASGLNSHLTPDFAATEGGGVDVHVGQAVDHVLRG